MKANVFVDDCCHTCHVLDANEVLEKGKNIKCAEGFWPNKQQTSCQLIWTEEEMVPNYDGASPPVVTVDILCSLFMIIICGYAAFFFIHRDHAAVSKSGSKLFTDDREYKICKLRCPLFSLHIWWCFPLPSVRACLPQCLTEWTNLLLHPVPEWSSTHHHVHSHCGQDKKGLQDFHPYFSRKQNISC